jgi:hypothetical protein
MSDDPVVMRERLVALVDEAERAVHDVEDQQREAHAAREAASYALEQLERQGAPEAERRKAEKALADARSRAAEPWAERASGARQRAVDARHELQRFSAANFDPIVDSLTALGERAAAEVDAAAQRMVEAFRRREAVAAELVAFVAEAGFRPEPNTVSASLAEKIAVACSDLLDVAGGERAPSLLRDPRVPPHAIVPAELSA